jgi:DNA-binding NarL/FixJ family response regulator
MNSFGRNLKLATQLYRNTVREAPGVAFQQQNRELCCALLASGFRKLTVDSGFESKGDYMPARSIRVLVVDDYEPFRRFFCSTLGRKADLQVIGEALDGLEAVQKAAELQPDLIVLDLGLPTLNGIEAARQIRNLSPKSKIIFVTLESSADVVQEAFGLGAQGYVIKTRAGSELLAAVEAARQGRQFISSGLSGLTLTNTPESQGPDDLHDEEALSSPAPRRGEITRSHEVEFYSDDAAFVVGFTRFIEAALEAGNAVIVVVTESHQKSLLQRFQEHRVNIAAAIEEGRYLALDVVEAISTFMVSDLPDPVRFVGIMSDLMAQAVRATAGEKSRVAICGECASILWAQGKADAAIQMEQLCNELATRYEMKILCGFSLSSFYSEEAQQLFQDICKE